MASLRNYEGSFPDISELIGVSIITVFPNIRHAFDSEEKQICPRVGEPIDVGILERLLGSETFRQAYFVPNDEDDVRPRCPFSLDDETKVLEYAPVRNTLGQFIESRVKMEQLVMARINNLIA